MDSTTWGAFWCNHSSTGFTLIHSSFSLMRSEPGRVLCPPISMMSTPASIHCVSVSKVWFVQRLLSWKESGVQLMTPMMAGDSRDRNEWPRVDIKFLLRFCISPLLLKLYSNIDSGQDNFTIQSNHLSVPRSICKENPRLWNGLENSQNFQFDWSDFYQSATH